MTKPKYRFTTVRKFNGDDSCSWAIFAKGQKTPMLAGLTKREIPYYRQQIESRYLNQNEALNATHKMWKEQHNELA